MKKKRIIHSALSLSLTAALCLSMAACLRYADARRQRRSFAARCTIRCGAALFCTDDLCGAAGKGIEPQAGGGKPLYGQERCKHSSRRL